MFHGVKPAGQPRTARTNAEARANAQSFPADLPYNYQAGMPSGEPGGSSSYDDKAAGLSGPAPRAEGQTPFVVTRGKK